MIAMKSVFRVFVPVFALALGFGITSLISGCGSKTPTAQETTVKGSVRINGHPVAGALVVFTPNADRGTSGKCAVGETNAEGVFSLSVAQSANIPAGWYRVSLAPPVTTPESAHSLIAAFPAKLARPDLSGLEREIQAGKQHNFDFVIEVGNQ
jgi:hypothetical protein